MKVRSLQFKLMAVVLAVAVVSNVAMALIARFLANDTVDETVLRLLDSVTNDVAGSIEDEVAKQFRLFEGIALIDFIQDEDIPFDEKCERMLSLNAVGSEYENITYYTVDGENRTKDGRIVKLIDREYIKQASKGKKYVSDPFFSSVANALLQTYAVPVKSSSGRIIGLIGANTWGDTLSKAIEDIDENEDSDIIVINRDTNIVVATTSSKATIGERADDMQNADVMMDFLIGLKSGSIGGGSFVDPVTKVKYTAAYRPVPNTDWSALYFCPYDDFFSGLTLMLRAMMITLVVILAVALVASYLTAHLSIKPLLTLKNAISEIATGDADLTKRITVTSNDEIGDVVTGFNAFSEKLHEIISQVKNSKDNLGTVGDNLAASTEDTSASITQILANIESIHSQINNQSQSVHETAGAVNEIASNIESLEHMIEKQSSGVSEASAAVEEMIGNIKSVNNSVEKMSNSFEALSESAHEGTKVQGEVNERVEEIKSLSETLQEANVAIASIASQTNLLAMNAAIEAAHAGEAGKGFAVVADEIRKLSETSSVQSKTIGDQLTSIQQAITSVVTASARSSDAFRTVSNKISETDELVRQIKAAMEEQNEGSQQISTALHVMNDSSLEVRNAGKEMMEGNQAILSEVRNLQDATGVIQGSMQEMSVGARKINETGEALKGISQQVKLSIDEIGGQIDKFTV